MTGHDEFEGLAAGYALHSLEPDDEQQLAAHLLTCPSCARMVADTAALGAAFADSLTPEPPPAGLRDRILAAAAAEPRTTTPAGETGLSRPPAEQPPLPSGAEPVAPPRRRQLVGGSGRARGHRGGDGNRRGKVTGRLAVGVLAAAVGVGVAVPVTLAVSDRNAPATSSSALAQWLLAPGAREVTLTGIGTTSVAKAVLTDRGVYLVADGLPVNDRARSTYVLWAGDSNGKLRAVTTFDVRGGSPVQLTAAALPIKMSDVTKVAVSYELGRSAPASPTKVVLSGTTA